MFMPSACHTLRLGAGQQQPSPPSPSRETGEILGRAAVKACAPGRVFGQLAGISMAHMRCR